MEFVDVEPLATMTCINGHRCSFDRQPKSVKCQQCTLYRVSQEEGLQLLTVTPTQQANPVIAGYQASRR